MKKSKVENKDVVVPVKEEPKPVIRPAVIASQKYIPLGHPNRPGLKLPELKAIVVHYTGNNNPGATDVANLGYMGRAFVKKETNFFESDGVTPFRYGSAHTFCDEDSAVIGIPTDEVAYSCGDRPMPYEPINKGQKPIARSLFNNKQNFYTVAVEICNNGDWDKACETALGWIAGYIKSINKKFDYPNSIKLMYQDESVIIDPGYIPLVRHFDVSGKICPKPLVDDPSKWIEFLKKLSNYGV